MTRKQIRLFVFITPLVFVFYSVLVYISKTPPEQGSVRMSEEAQAGKSLFQKHNCVACHQLYGLGGFMGPDLTDFTSRYEQAPVIAKAFLANGTKRMPAFHMSDSEVNAIVAFLSHVDQTGNFPDTTIRFDLWGTIRTKHK